MENWTVLISFLILLLGVFALRKLWLGALLALLFVFVSKAIVLQDLAFALLPFGSGFVISIELALLLFGAYLFYHTLYHSGHFTKFIEVNASFSSKLFVILILC
ncbi:MAG: hypothetical protein Q8S14_15450 [Algoriphagus sp.]|uniref:hypothetical protein n=1 Tax=Algoriphagus sp. TaxID=1872435 RepID=UPI00272FA67A|nr:hypothetical protein [Algoriphagus sp.]MDP2042246.1 hypothetical protein [Algoriphagus sp.]MDP3473261.1 hypothetical protein [Algoriphagus sp.]